MSGVEGTGRVDPRHVMREAHDRRFEREGVPMVLALFDERTPGRDLPAAAEVDVRRQGEHYADTAGDFARTLFPQARDTDLASSIVVLQALAYSGFAPISTEPIISAAPDGAAE